MADSVKTSLTEGTKYTWGTCPFTWRETTKLWRYAAPTVYTLDRGSYVAASDAEKSNTAMNKLETLSVKEQQFKQIVKSVYRAIGVFETYWDNIRFFIKTCESFAITDDEKNKIGLNILVSLRVGERLMRKGAKLLADSFVVSDELLRHTSYYRQYEEAVNTLERYNKHAGTFKAEALEIIESGFNKELWKNPIEMLKTQEHFYRTFIATKKLFEDIIADEKLINHPTKETFEQLAAFDAYVKNCESVLSNIYISKAEISNNEDFMNVVNAPPGFTTFSDFKVGEYEYEEALIKVTLKTNAPALTPSVADVVMHVDIPDTDDRGVVEITDTSEPTLVHFNKHYYTPPEVSVVVRGGSTESGNIIPYIISTEGIDDAGRYFTVELRDSGNNRTTGTISWIAKGY